jgi:hypothetical protein
MIGKFCIDLGSDIAGLIGGILLVKPAWRATRLAKRVVQLESIQLTPQDHPDVGEVKDGTIQQTKAQITTWERSDELAILWGMGLVIFSFGIKIVWALITGPEAH